MNITSSPSRAGKASRIGLLEVGLVLALLGLVAYVVRSANFSFDAVVPSFLSQRHPWESVCALAFSPDGKYLAAGLREGTSFCENFHWCVADLRQSVALFGLNDGFEPSLLDCDARPATRGGLAGTYQGEFLCFTPDSTSLLIGTLSGHVKLWSLPHQGPQQTMEVDEGTVGAVAACQDGEILASGGLYTCMLWKGAGLKPSELVGYASHVKSIAFSHQGGLLAVGGDNPEVEIWKLSNGTRELVPLSMDAAYSVQFSPDSRLLAIAGGNKALLWDVDQRKQRFALPTEGATGVAFAPDGKTVAVAGKVGVTRWQVRNGASADSPKLPANARCLAYSKDGRMIATGQRWGDHVTIWDADTGQRIWTGPVPRHGRSASSVSSRICALALLLLALGCFVVVRKRRMRGAPN